MIGRSERGAFIEFLEAQRDASPAFGPAFTFEAKLAQGGAQQCRSVDIYRLNRGLDLFTRFVFFFLVGVLHYKRSHFTVDQLLHCWHRIVCSLWRHIP